MMMANPPNPNPNHIMIPLEFSSECLKLEHTVHPYFFLDTPATNGPLYLQILSVLPSYLNHLPSSLKVFIIIIKPFFTSSSSNHHICSFRLQAFYLKLNVDL